MKYPKTPGAIRKKKDTLIAEYSGYSTVFDALFLLVLVSLAGVLLMPSLQAEKQYVAAGYVTSSEFSTSPTGSENHLASFRFQNTFLLNV